VCRCALAQNADDTGAGQAAMDFQSITRQLASHQFGGPQLIECEFGVRVDVAPDCREFIEKRDVQRCHKTGLSTVGCKFIPE
jgi:hypothetical protein